MHVLRQHDSAFSNCDIECGQFTDCSSESEHFCCTLSFGVNLFIKLYNIGLVCQSEMAVAFR